MTRARFRAAICATAPTVLLVGFVYHPYIAPSMDLAAIAAAAASDTLRWGLAHLAIGVGYGLVVLAFLAIRSYLREAGEERWSVLALPFIVMGSTLLSGGGGSRGTVATDAGDLMAQDGSHLDRRIQGFPTTRSKP